MDQYRGVVKQHTSFTLDLLRHTNDGSTYKYSSNFRQGTAYHPARLSSHSFFTAAQILVAPVMI